MRMFLAAALFIPACVAVGCTSADDAHPAADAGSAVGNAVDGGSDGAPACEVPSSNDPLVVATTMGLVQGVSSSGVRRFAGIPYAAPPVGEGRFHPPADPACRHDVVDATDFGAICPQPDLLQTGHIVGDEDCLTLNVWTPSAAAPLRPILFWIHGGANVLGSSAQVVNGQALYDGSTLASERDVVVVSANYRLGALGFFADPSLDAESEHGVSGNYAILDLIAALRFVQQNAAAFGGDPNRVMIFGESAGAYNVCALMGSPLAAGLFSSALMESGACEQPTLAFREAQALPMLQKLGCTESTTPADVAACLRAAPVQDLLAAPAVDITSLTTSKALDVRAPHETMQSAVVDGWVLPASTVEAFAAGTANHVPFAIGTNANEYNFFLALTPTSSLTCLSYEAELRGMFPDDVDDILKLYPCNALQPRASMSDVITDFFFTCPARRAARAAAAGNQRRVFRYFFTHSRTLGATSTMGAYHTVEIPFVFGTLGKNGDVATNDEQALGHIMRGDWTRFASFGDPNGGGDPAWPAYELGQELTQVFDLQVGNSNGVRTELCDYWDQLHDQ